MLAEVGEDDDPVVRALARKIAARLSIWTPRDQRERSRGSGRTVSVRHREGAAELDLDRSVEAFLGLPDAKDEDLVARERLRRRRSVVLLVDVSGSMKGERILTAAAAVGAIAAELHRDHLAVVAFWSNAAQLAALGDRIDPQNLLDSMLRIPARGLTNVAFPLELAVEQLRDVPARDSRVLLLSDCVHNAGPDPREFAARAPRVDVLLDASGEHDAGLAAELARRGRGRLRVLHRYTDVAPALNAVFRF